MNSTINLKKSAILKSNIRDPRRNLPLHLMRKRGESNLANAFQRKYVEDIQTQGIGACHFALTGYGIADFVWIRTPQMLTRKPYTLTENDIRRELLKTLMVAFEMKLMDWRKAIQQAYRYSYFADKAIVVLPNDRKTAILPQIDFFKQMNIGLWFFDTKNRNIIKAFSPLRSGPKNISAKKKAIDLFIRQFYLRAIDKRTNSLT
ncbi:MAG: hypothetical protein ABSE89_11425 [Sedimentisphaerales bacterium]